LKSKKKEMNHKYQELMKNKSLDDFDEFFERDEEIEEQKNKDNQD